MTKSQKRERVASKGMKKVVKFDDVHEDDYESQNYHQLAGISSVTPPSLSKSKTKLMLPSIGRREID